MLEKGSAGGSRAAMDSDLQLDKCKRYLESLGFGPRELATLDINDSSAIAKQLAFELNVTASTELEDAIVDWIQDARAPAKMAMRLEGVLASDIEWGKLATRRRFGPETVPEKPPPPGDRVRKLELSGCELLAREERLLVFWTKQLQVELCASGAPVLQKLEDSLDPTRALEMLAGRTRAGTLKRYVDVYQRWRLWLQEAKLMHPPGRPVDLVDYWLVRRDEPFGRSVPETIVKAIAWFEKVAEFRSDSRATEGRIVWATKDKIVEALSEGAPLTQRAPRYPTWILVKIERLVLDEDEAKGIRIFAWAKLFKAWASLRWSDIQAIKPTELRLEEGRLFTILRRTKTSGPNRRIKELPVCVSEGAFFEDAKWISVGFHLLKEMADYKRDYLLPRLKADLVTLDRKMASYGGAVVATAAILARIGLPTAVQGYWTEHSERSILPTALAILGVTDSEKDILGRWKPEGSDTYVRSYGRRVARLQSRYAAVARDEGRYSQLDEREIAANLLDWLQDRKKLSEEASRAIVDPLVHMWKTGKIYADLIPVVPEEENEPQEEAGADSEDSQGPEQASSLKAAKTVERSARYVIVELPGAIFRLHRAGANGCWMGRKREFKSSRDFPDMPDRTDYTHVCRLCWPDGQFDSDDNPSDASPAGSGDEAENVDSQGDQDWSQTEPVSGSWPGYDDSWQQIGSG